MHTEHSRFAEFSLRTARSFQNPCSKQTGYRLPGRQPFGPPLKNDKNSSTAQATASRRAHERASLAFLLPLRWPLSDKPTNRQVAASWGGRFHYRRLHPRIMVSTHNQKILIRFDSARPEAQISFSSPVNLIFHVGLGWSDTRYCGGQVLR